MVLVVVVDVVVVVVVVQAARKAPNIVWAPPTGLRELSTVLMGH